MLSQELGVKVIGKSCRLLADVSGYLMYQKRFNLFNIVILPVV